MSGIGNEKMRKGERKKGGRTHRSRQGNTWLLRKVDVGARGSEDDSWVHGQGDKTLGIVIQARDDEINEGRKGLTIYLAPRTVKV
jgi:hypothetical protein